MPQGRQSTHMIIPLWVGLGGSKEHGNTLVFPKPHFKNVPWKKIDKKEIFQSITVILEHQERDGS